MTLYVTRMDDPRNGYAGEEATVIWWLKIRIRL